jgi:hypothetical protein
MSAPAMGSATSTTQIAVSSAGLTPGVATGGATIDSYHLVWDQGTGTWADLAGEEGNY